MDSIRVLIADDERPARGELSYLLRHVPGVEVVGECANGKEVLAFLKTHLQVDLVFLDIEMPLLNGLETAKEIRRLGYPLQYVFATGYSQFAVEAFALEAFDYILKPYEEQRIRRIAQRWQTLKERAPEGTAGDMGAGGNQIILRSEGRMVFVKTEDISLVATEKSDGTLFYTKQGVLASKMTLREAEEILAGHRFFRTHKGYLVNINRVETAEPSDNGTLLLTVKGFPKEKVPVSRHYLKAFRRLVGI